MLCGAAAAALHARDETAGDAIIEMIGGAIAGYYAAALPDILEPARKNPRHRSTCHSLATLLLVLFAAVEHYRQNLRERAKAAHEASGLSALREDRVVTALLEIICRLVAGALACAQAGYASHLIMDGNTPASLPLICRGF